jgi:hypothetical protein
VIGRLTQAVGVALLAALALVGCQDAPSGHAVIENATDIPLAVHVNGTWVGTYPAGATAEVPIRIGAGPFRLEARSDSGATLSALEVTADDVAAVNAGTRSLQATSDTPCGMIRLTYGDAAVEPMPAATSAPGPCP